MRRLVDMARVIRSKNSGPFELTLDILFNDAATFEAARESGEINPQRVAELYAVPSRDVTGIVWFSPAHAVKIVLRRRVPSGARGDSDVYGAQQHAPLLSLQLAVDARS
jgi:hypothetical protein